MRRGILTVLFLVMWGIAAAQEGSDMEAIMKMAGAVSAEEMDSYEVERLSDFLEHPLKINVVSSSRLSSSGLFSRYQVASLMDYRARHGNVMSLAELAAVDGFGEDFVARLAPFVSLESLSLGLMKEPVRNDLAVRGAFKMNDGNDWNSGLKYRFEASGFTMSLAANRAYGSEGAKPSDYAGSVGYDFRKIRGKVLLGDFNARFGQGLVLWNGAFITSLSTPSAFMKKPSGLSRSWSYTGGAALTGAAAEVGVEGFTLSAVLAIPGVKDASLRPDEVRLMPAANIAWQCRHGQVSVTHMAELSGFRANDQVHTRIPVMKTSADAAFCVRGVNIYGEAAYDWVDRNVDVLAGTDFKAEEDVRLAALCRYFPDELYGTAFSGAFRSGTFSVDAVYYPVPKDDSVKHSIQVKSQVDWNWTLGQSFTIRMRASERFRTWGNRFRSEIRGDFVYASGPFVVTIRLNALHCDKIALAGYLEQGYKTDRFSVYTRQTIFKVDDWDDRIYVYERDAPGSFNVPALYGRGWSASLVSSAKIASLLRLYARASYTGYHLMPAEKRKPGKAELKLQLVFRF